MLAYYMFVNHGWRPSQEAGLPTREKILLAQFIRKEMRARQRAKEGT